MKDKLKEIKNKYPRIALAHDFLLYSGGAERVISEIALLFPNAPIFVLNANTKMRNKWRKRKIITSFLSKIPIPHQWLLLLYPIATESIDFREFDLVISSSSSFMKGIIVKPRTTHISFCHSPTRYLWDWSNEYIEENINTNLFGIYKRFFVRLATNYLRMWDQSAVSRVDHFIANSSYTSKRIKKYYGCNSEVVYPPVSVEKFPLSKTNKGYFLVVSRLSAYKRIDLVIEAFNRLGWPLIIAGTGKEKRGLKKIARNNIKFLDYVKEKNLPKLYAECRAFIFPGEDDFGITMIEAMASGKPVLAYKKGGSLEIIEEGKTGEFFDSPEVEILVDGLRRLIENEKNYSPEYIRNSALKFSREKFRENFIEAINKMINRNPGPVTCDPKDSLLDL